MGADGVLVRQPSAHRRPAREMAWRALVHDDRTREGRRDAGGSRGRPQRRGRYARARVPKGERWRSGSTDERARLRNGHATPVSAGVHGWCRARAPHLLRQRREPAARARRRAPARGHRQDRARRQSRTHRARASRGAPDPWCGRNVARRAHRSDRRAWTPRADSRAAAALDAHRGRPAGSSVQHRDGHRRGGGGVVWRR
jgi:hypothetical protein